MNTSSVSKRRRSASALPPRTQPKRSTNTNNNSLNSLVEMADVSVRMLKTGTVIANGTSTTKKAAINNSMHYTNSQTPMKKNFNEMMNTSSVSKRRRSASALPPRTQMNTSSVSKRRRSASALPPRTQMNTSSVSKRRRSASALPPRTQPKRSTNTNNNSLNSSQTPMKKNFNEMMNTPSVSKRRRSASALPPRTQPKRSTNTNNNSLNSLVEMADVSVRMLKTGTVIANGTSTTKKAAINNSMHYTNSQTPMKKNFNEMMNTPSASKRRRSSSASPPRSKKKLSTSRQKHPPEMADLSAKMLVTGTVTNDTPTAKETSIINSMYYTNGQTPAEKNLNDQMNMPSASKRRRSAIINCMDYTNSQTPTEENPNDMVDLSMDMLRSKVEGSVKKIHGRKSQLDLDTQLEKKKEEALKSMKILLENSEKYGDYLKNKLQDYCGHNTRSQKDETLNNNSADESTDEDETIHRMDLKYFEGGSLMPHQIEGVLWLSRLYENGINGILADEMGLGKTIQIIALICSLFEKNIEGPYLIIGPLSVLYNWACEFKRFAPQIPILVFHGYKNDWANLQSLVSQFKYKLNGKNVKPVILTTYEGALKQLTFLQQYKWQYLIIDEGHKIKNSESLLFCNLKSLNTSNRLLLTGTPLQNNLSELWALLNFILPHIFVSMDTFASVLLLDDLKDGNKVVQQEESTQVISTIHKVLSPFMLRRTKADCVDNMAPKKEVIVYCPLSQFQLDMYIKTISKNVAAIKRQVPSETDVLKEIENLDNTPRRSMRSSRKNYVEPDENDVESLFREDVVDDSSTMKIMTKKNENYAYRITSQNIMVMCKKVVDHPYLVELPLKVDENGKKAMLVNEDLITKSGKMLVLDAMLSKLKKQGHKVLIFSTLVTLLDLLEEYVLMRGYKYCRLDGSTKIETRKENIERFNNDSDTFLFLISTRAGGLGLNLTRADTVIMFDRDWNPQVDIQAQARCHRIGQTKPVMIFSLITKNTIDEKILEYSEMKRRLEKIVIQDGKFKSIKRNGDDTIELNMLLGLLKGDDSLSKIHANGFVFSDQELEQLLDRSELYKQLEESKKTKK